jgi:hypothetical protein
MSYVPDIGPDAAHDLARLPLPVAEFVERQIHALCEQPTKLSTRSRFPFVQNAQLFSFEMEFEETRYWFNVLFQYGQDEQTLHILAIAIQTS